MLTNQWDERFLAMARLVAGWSKDPSTKVGAVIVDMNNRIVSVGYNGFPRGVKDTPERLNDRETRLMLTVHAEANAILFAHKDMEGCALYVSHPPCANCAALIAQHCICEVIYPTPTPVFADRWRAHIKAAELIFGDCNINFRSCS